MPLYEFLCANCGTLFEDLVFSNDDRPVCPSCGDAKAERQLSVFATSTGAGRTCDPGMCNDLPSCGSSCPGGSCPYSA